VASFNSDIVSIPGLALTDCIAATVPKAVGSVFFGSGNPLTSTFVKYDYATGNFITSTNDEAIGYCETSAASGDTTVAVKLLPFMYYKGGFHGPIDTGGWDTPGAYNIFNQNMAEVVDKLDTQAWAFSASIYWSVALQKATTISTGNLFIGYARFATAASARTGIIYRQYAFKEAFQFGDTPPVQNNGTEQVKRLPGTSFASGQQLAIDKDGNHFALSDTTKYGVATRKMSAETMAADSESITATSFETAAQKIWFNYKQMLIASQKQQITLIMPKIASPELINNSLSREVYARSGQSPISYEYIYVYQVQGYKMLRTINFGSTGFSTNVNRLMTPTDSVPPISIPVPSGLTWTATSDPGPYTAPGPVDQAGTHTFIYEGTWALFKNDANSDTHDTGIYANKPRGNYSQFGGGSTIRTSTGAWTTFSKTDYGKANGQTYVIDPTRRWQHTYTFFENTTGPSAGSLRVLYSVYRTEADGSETTLKDWTEVSRENWYTVSNLQYVKFNINIALSDFGETYPLLRYQTDYTIRYRQYHSNVSPYNSTSSQYGSLAFFGLNEAGFASSYGDKLYYYQKDHAYYYSVLPYAMAKSDGTTYTTNFIKGASYENFTYDCPCTGLLTLNKTIVDANRIKVSWTSTLTPATDAAHLQSNSTGNTLMRIRRLSDGLYLHAYVDALFTTIQGCKWSNYVTMGTPQYTSTTNGSDKNAGYRVGYTTREYWVDRNPNMTTTESYELEVLTYGQGNFRNSFTRYFARRDLLYFSI
jgi:predicted RecA/RadA family phage recombinase